MRFPIKIVYVCGTITAASAEARQDNIEKGKRAGAEVWRMGAVPLVPHLNTLGMFEKELIPGADIYLGDLELLDRCDVMLRLPGWEPSRGCRYETAWAQLREIPIFDSLEALKKYLEFGSTTENDIRTLPRANDNTSATVKGKS